MGLAWRPEGAVPTWGMQDYFAWIQGFLAGEIQDVASAKTLLRAYDFQQGNHSYCEELLVAPFIDRIDRYFFDPGWDYGDLRYALGLDMDSLKAVLPADFDPGAADMVLLPRRFAVIEVRSAYSL